MHRQDHTRCLLQRRDELVKQVRVPVLNLWLKSLRNNNEQALHEFDRVRFKNDLLRSLQPFDVESQQQQEIPSTQISCIRAVQLANGHEVPIEVNEDPSEVAAALRGPTIFGNVEDFNPDDLKESMKKEMQSTLEFDVYATVDASSLDQDSIKQAMTLKWVHTWTGFVKSRLCVRGYRQEISDLDETYASTPVMTSRRVLLVMALSKGWMIQMREVSTAFLHADLQSDEPVYVWHPREFYPQGGVLWKLKRATYGLRSSPRDWQTHFAKVLASLQFARLQSDADVYVHLANQVYVLVYVDDLLGIGDPSKVKQTLQELGRVFCLKDVGSLDQAGSTITFLGRELKRLAASITLKMKSG